MKLYINPYAFCSAHDGLFNFRQTDDGVLLKVQFLICASDAASSPSYTSLKDVILHLLFTGNSWFVLRFV